MVIEKKKKNHDTFLRMTGRFQAHWIIAKAHFEEDKQHRTTGSLGWWTVTEGKVVPWGWIEPRDNGLAAGLSVFYFYLKNIIESTFHKLSCYAYCKHRRREIQRLALSSSLSLYVSVVSLVKFWWVFRGELASLHRPVWQQWQLLCRSNKKSPRLTGPVCQHKTVFYLKFSYFLFSIWCRYGATQCISLWHLKVLWNRAWIIKIQNMKMPAKSTTLL